jgi:uncharacterized protein YbjQ (UPF0145 family)
MGRISGWLRAASWCPSTTFKRFSAKIHSFFGGRLSVYESLLDRARREALLRMRERALLSGATMIFGVRLEVTSINNGNPNRGTTGVEMIAYGTAIVPAWRGSSQRDLPESSATGRH